MSNELELLNMIGEIVPQVYITNIILNSASQNGDLKVSVNMEMKDVLGNDSISQWFSDEDFRKYVKVLMIESRSAEISAFLTSNFQSLRELSETKLKNAITSKFGTGDITFRDAFIPAAKSSNTVFSNENYKQVDESGNQVVTIPLKIDFVSKEAFPSHLAYFALTSFNLKALKDALGIDVELQTDVIFSNAPVSEIALDGGNIVSESQVFVYLGTNNPYLGSVHLDENSLLMTGETQTIDSKQLELLKFPNYIVQDYRLRHFFERKTAINEADFTSPFEQIRNITTGIYTVEKTPEEILNAIKSIKNEPVGSSFSKYFSEVLSTSDRDGSVRFQFNFDKLAFLKDAVFYRPILTDSNSASLLCNRAKIKNISIYRVRKDIALIDQYSENQPILLVQNGSNLNDGKESLLVQSNENSYIQEVFLDNVNSDFIKTYSVCDKEIKDINCGLYDYKVEMQLTDPTVEYVREQVELLVPVVNNFQQYYDKSLSAKEIKPIVGDVNSKQRGSIVLVPWYDNDCDKFLEEFQMWFERFDILNSYSTFLTIYTNFITGNKVSPVANSEFINLFSPLVGSPEGIKIVCEVMQTLLAQLQSLTTPIQTDGQGQRGKKNNLLDLSYTLAANSDASESDGIGYSFFSDRFTNQSGLNVLNVDRMFSVVQAQDDKYLKTATTFNYKTMLPALDNFYDFEDNSTNSQFSYVTPSSIVTKDSTYDMNSPAFFNSDEICLNALLDIVNYNTVDLPHLGQHNQQKNGLEAKQQTLRFKLMQLIDSLSGISASDSHVPTFIEQFVNVFEKSSYFNIFGTADNSKAATQSKIQQESSPIQNETLNGEVDKNTNPNSLLLAMLVNLILDDSTKKNGKLFDSSVFRPLLQNGAKNEQFFVDQKRGAATVGMLFSGLKFSNDYVKSLPNAIKSLILQGTGVENLSMSEDDSKIPEKFFRFWDNFKNIYKIETFNGFEKDSIKSPKWALLTDIGKIKGNVLCRISKFKLDGFEEYFPDVATLDLPILDKYFYLTNVSGFQVPPMKFAAAVFIPKQKIALGSNIPNLSKLIQFSTTNDLLFAIPLTIHSFIPQESQTRIVERVEIPQETRTVVEKQTRVATVPEERTPPQKSTRVSIPKTRGLPSNSRLL